MNVLILGGTRFVGFHITAAALARGHRVSVFNRGRTHPDLFPEVEKLRGDRDGDLSALAGRRWDAVIDVNAYLPRQVRTTAELLRDAVDRYVFLSTISVYADLSVPGTTEESPLKEPRPGDEDVREIPPGGYGRLKVLCERTLDAALPGRVLHVRPCIVAGPEDHTGRFTYWAVRISRGGEVLAPGRPERPVQIIDARDLASWVVAMAERRETGVCNAVGPVLTMREILETCREVSGSSARFAWVSDEFLAEHGVRLPLWQPEKEGVDAVRNDRAAARGLSCRPLAETVRDTLAWASESPEERAPARLVPEAEAGLLRKWRGAQGGTHP